MTQLLFVRLAFTPSPVAQVKDSGSCRYTASSWCNDGITYDGIMHDGIKHHVRRKEGKKEGRERK